MRRTGNPFVDMGLGIITVLAEKDRIEDLTIEDLKVVFGKHDLATINKELKSFTMIFGTNGPLYQYSYRKHNKEIYRDLLALLLEEICITKGKNVCEICGEVHSFSIDNIWRQVIEKYGYKVKERKIIGRDFFPLIGSIGNDAQALPSASRVFNICPKCLFAVNYIPLGTMLINGRLICIESTSEIIMIELIREIVSENLARISAGNRDTYGKKEGKTELYRRLLSMFTRIQKIKRYENLSETTALYLWLFSNSGQNPDCDILEIPNKSLKFIWEVSRKSQDFRNEFLQLISQDKKGILFDCINNGMDYFGLYPKGKYKGVDYRLYEYYQIYVVGRSPRSLNFAKKVACRIQKDVDKKALRKIQKSDAFKDNKNLSIVKKVIVSLIIEGQADFEEYLDLFGEDGKYLSFNYEGYKVINYYLNNLDTPMLEKEEINLDLNIKSKNTDKKIKAFAELYFNYYVLDKEKGLGRGIKRFKKDVLDEFNNFKESWLQDKFAKLAESYECDELNLDYDGWVDFITDDEGNKRVYELLFQLRLAFANLYYQYNKKEDN